MPRRIGTLCGVALATVAFASALAPVAHGAAPETTITGGPPEGSELNSTTASFAFSSSAKGQTKFYCSIDGAPTTSCSSGVTYSNLSTGPHSFSVYSVDRSGAADPTPATRSWAITTSREVYPVPASVPSGCSTDATSKILSWIASVPNNSTLRVRCGRVLSHRGNARASRKRNLLTRRQRFDVQVAQCAVRPACHLAGMGLDHQLSAT